MAELRVDPLSGLRVLVAEGPEPTLARSTRPGHVDRAHVGAPLTPDAPEPPRTATPDLFTSVAARGVHEELPLRAPLTALAAEELREALAHWRERMAAHPEAAHVHVGAGAGEEPQLWALDFVPAAVARERERCAAYATRTQGSDLLGDLVQAEVRGRERLVAYDDEAVLLAPFASRAPFQLVVVPRTPTPRFEAPGVLGAALLHRGLAALTAHLGAAPPVAVWVRTAPRGAQHFCWRIDVVPQLLVPGGLELGVGVPVNPVAPEQAAALLKPLAR